jgi:hypothetical protein
VSAPTKEIGGRTFSFGTIPAVKAVRVEIAIARVIGEPLFKAFMDSQGKPESVQLDVVAGAIGVLTAKMDADELIKTMGIVFESVSLDGVKGPVDMDVHFTGKNKDLWLVFVEALKVNFGDFLPGGLSGSLAALVPQK